MKLEHHGNENKPVVVYIVILFIAAFLLMALSSLMHQRDNSQALDELQSSVSAIQQIQDSQVMIIDLQEELAQTKKDLDTLETQHKSELDTAQQQIDQQKQKLDAMTNLYFLEHAFQVEDYDSCQRIIQAMETNGQVDALLVEGAAEGSPSEGLVFPSFWNQPRHRFDHIKEAVEAKLAH